MVLQMDKDLSLEEMGVFATMVNLPEADYTTAEYLASQSSDKAEHIETLLCSLLEKRYVLKVGGKYAVNKEMIPQVVKSIPINNENDLNRNAWQMNKKCATDGVGFFLGRNK